MRSLFESPEVFEAYARIDYRIFLMKSILKEASQPSTGINAAIDRATGFDKAKDNETKETLREMLMEQIADKKFIEADYTHEEEILEMIQ